MAWLTAPDSAALLGTEEISGKLAESARALTADAGRMLGPLQDAMNKEARETWLLQCVPAVADGRMTPEACWDRVMGMGAFE